MNAPQLRSVCASCGEVFDNDDGAKRGDCYTCRPPKPPAPGSHLRGTTRERGYGTSWRKLSERARRLSPVCEDCGSFDDLTADHSTEAWDRHAKGKTIRLQDISVVCRSCNSERGAARGARADDHRQWERDRLSGLVHELDREDENDTQGG